MTNRLPLSRLPDMQILKSIVYVDFFFFFFSGDERFSEDLVMEA